MNQGLEKSLDGSDEVCSRRKVEGLGFRPLLNFSKLPNY